MEFKISNPDLNENPVRTIKTGEVLYPI